MTTTDLGARARTPVWFWVVAVLGVLWNAYGAYDYFMTNTQGDAYLVRMGMTPAQIAYFHQAPDWTVAAWAFGVWGGLAGALLLLARTKWAFHAFVVSLLGLIASLVYTYLLSDGAGVMGQTGMIMNVVILAGCLFFVWFARAMTRRGVLR